MVNTLPIFFSPKLPPKEDGIDACFCTCITYTCIYNKFGIFFFLSGIILNAAFQCAFSFIHTDIA